MSNKPEIAKSPERKDIDMNKLDNFMDNVEKEFKNEENNFKYPWDNCNPKIIKLINLRINEVHAAKLKYIIDNSLDFNSVHQFCISAVEKEIKKQLKNIIQ